MADPNPFGTERGNLPCYNEAPEFVDKIVCIFDCRI